MLRFLLSTATEEIRQCPSDEIVAVPAYLHIISRATPTAIGWWQVKLEQLVPILAIFQRKRVLLSFK